MSILYTGIHGPFTKVTDIAKDIVKKLTENGFDLKFPTPPIAYDGTGKAILEPSEMVDPLRATKPTWRIAITPDDTEETIKLNIATPTQIKDDGSIAAPTITGWANEFTEIADGTTIKKVHKNPGEIPLFVDRRHLKSSDFDFGAAYPMSYALTVSDHGVFLAIWDNGFDEYQNEFDNYSPAFRWVVIQRPVDNQTGEPLIEGRAPVFCVYTIIDKGFLQPTADYKLYQGGTPTGVSTTPPPSIKYGEYYVILRDVTAQFHYKFVVCEEDVYRPSLMTLADMSQPDSNPIINSSQQVSISEDNKYVVTIPKGLNTTRYAYTHELDMIAYTSADVIGMLTEVELPLYGNSYKYKALIANRLKNTGMRILYRVE